MSIVNHTALICEHPVCVLTDTIVNESKLGLVCVAKVVSGGISITVDSVR